METVAISLCPTHFIEYKGRSPAKYSFTSIFLCLVFIQDLLVHIFIYQVVLLSCFSCIYVIALVYIIMQKLEPKIHFTKVCKSWNYSKLYSIYSINCLISAFISLYSLFHLYISFTNILMSCFDPYLPYYSLATKLFPRASLSSHSNPQKLHPHFTQHVHCCLLLTTYTLKVYGDIYTMYTHRRYTLTFKQHTQWRYTLTFIQRIHWQSDQYMYWIF